MDFCVEENGWIFVRLFALGVAAQRGLAVFCRATGDFGGNLDRLGGKWYNMGVLDPDRVLARPWLSCVGRS